MGDYRTFAKVMPPLRSESDRAAIAEAVADGTIDAICSDHAPQDQDASAFPLRSRNGAWRASKPCCPYRSRWSIRDA